MSVSTHVLDAVTGRPAAAVGLLLERRAGETWIEVVRTVTDADGRAVLSGASAGVHRLTFDVAGYLGPDAFYPEVAVTFRIADAGAHHHVPLLLSPFAYSTYRGS